MYHIFESKFKLKPDSEEQAMIRSCEEVAFPILRKVPGLVSIYLLKHTASGSGGPLEWDYSWFEIWESDEAHKRAISDRYIVGEDSQLGKTGFYEQTLASIEKWDSSWGTLIASIE